MILVGNKAAAAISRKHVPVKLHPFAMAVAAGAGN
jgi:hypothetical protein